MNQFEYENKVQNLVYNAAMGNKCAIEGCNGTPIEAGICQDHLEESERSMVEWINGKCTHEEFDPELMRECPGCGESPETDYEARTDIEIDDARL